MSLTLCVSVSLTLCVSVSLTLCVSVSLTLCVSVSVCLVKAEHILTYERHRLVPPYQSPLALKYTDAERDKCANSKSVSAHWPFNKLTVPP